MRPRLYYSASSFNDEIINKLEKKYASISTPYFIMGVIFKNKTTGMRAKSRNPNYEYIKKLRGNHANPIHRFIDLRKKNLVKEYLNYYPEDRTLFKEYIYKIKNYIYHLHNYYVNCYILQKNPLKNYPANYKTHMYYIHNEYKRTGIKQTYNKVKRYFNNLTSFQQINIINFL